MWKKTLLTIGILSILIQYGESIMCHRCFSAMGGCGSDGVNWRMFPWRSCGQSKFCVKVVTYTDGEAKIIRECESELMKSPYHRLRMPVLRRHGYCRPARKNDFWNPTETLDTDTEYCFCNDWNGCNSAQSVFGKIYPVISLCTAILFTMKQIIL